jgi:hypothetical protein
MKHPFIKKKQQSHFVQNTPSYNSGVRRQEPTGASQPMNPMRVKGSKTPLSFGQYTALAQAAMDQGDRVLAETYYQYAEYALRLKNETKENSSTSIVHNSLPTSQEKAVRTKHFETSLENELEKA